MRIRRYFIASVDMPEDWLRGDDNSGYREGWRELERQITHVFRTTLGQGREWDISFEEWEEVQGCQCYRGQEKGFAPCINCIRNGGVHSPFCISPECQERQQHDEEMLHLQKKSTCEHGIAWDVHCEGCHTGFDFGKEG